MKRGGPLQRRTPLQARTPLSRGSGLSRRSQVKPARQKQRRKWAQEHCGGWQWIDVREVCYERAAGRCERCDRALRFSDMQAHHRRSRTIGPDCPCNTLALCERCHHAKTHQQPEKAMEDGRIISRHSTVAPSTVPVKLARGTVLLACDGTWKFAA